MELLALSRGSIYDERKHVDTLDLEMMRIIYELRLTCRFAGARMLRDMLRHRGFAVGRRHVAALMLHMGIERCTASLRRLVGIPSTSFLPTCYAA